MERKRQQSKYSNYLTYVKMCLFMWILKWITSYIYQFQNCFG